MVRGGFSIMLKKKKREKEKKANIKRLHEEIVRGGFSIMLTRKRKKKKIKGKKLLCLNEEILREVNSGA